MLALGVIEPSTNPWASPLVLVPKATRPGSSAELNSATRTDDHPITRTDELIDRLCTSRFLSIFDLTSRYWQIALTEGAKERSAFSIPEGHFQFWVMPFGMKNAPATF